MSTQQDDLGIKEFNWKAHQDINKEMCSRINGLFSFVIKLNNGNITDLVVLENLSSTTLFHEPINNKVPQNTGGTGK